MICGAELTQTYTFRITLYNFIKTHPHDRKKDIPGGIDPSKDTRGTPTWKPPLMVSANQTCFLSFVLLVHQFFLGMLLGVG